MPPGDPAYEDAQGILDAYDALWAAPMEFVAVPRSDSRRRDRGMLKAHGYFVSAGAGRSRELRTRLLEQIFHRQLAPLDSAEYRDSWGAPRTRQRLERMIQAICDQLDDPSARYLRNANARRRWQNDHSALRAKLQAALKGLKAWLIGHPQPLLGSCTHGG